jgi:hypothetical protein
MRAAGIGFGKPAHYKIVSKKKLMEPKKFEQIVNQAVSLQGRPVETRACPDQFLGLVRELTTLHSFSKRVPAHQRPDHACVLLVLESPHVEEFIGEPGPAKGATGEMIRQYLPTVLGLPNIQDHGLLLVNAIQHQCSLGTNTKVYRDRIFRAVWTNGGESDFRNRIASWFRSGDVLVNCCTKGNDAEVFGPLRNLVEKALQATIPNVVSLHHTHPASWFDAKWRGREWKV